MPSCVRKVRSSMASPKGHRRGNGEPRRSTASRPRQAAQDTRTPCSWLGPWDSDDTAGQWGFTIVRRQNPKGLAKSTVYAYLAPLDADEKPSNGEVLRFHADALSAMPLKNAPYARNLASGTVIKMYEFL